MKKIVFSLALLLLNILLFAENIADITTVSIPVFYPDSDTFFAAEFQNAFSKFPSFFYLDMYGDLIYIPKGAEAVRDIDGGVVKMAASIGAMIPLGEHLSGIASFSGVGDSPYIVQSFNFFTGGGLFGHYQSVGLGLFAGYYRDSYQALPEPEDDSGIYRGILDDQPATITNAVRFLVIPKIGLSNKVFFLDEIGALFNISEKFDITNILGKLAFKTLELGAMKLGIDLYYTQSKYNMLLEHKSLGAKFETKYLSIDAGYRWFIHSFNNNFLSNYQDGVYGRIIVKLPKSTWLSYGFERTFETTHYIGFGVSLSMHDDDWTNDLFYEFSAIQNMRFSMANLTSLERYF
jgi:hypothetical protein